MVSLQHEGLAPRPLAEQTLDEPLLEPARQLGDRDEVAERAVAEPQAGLPVACDDLGDEALLGEDAGDRLEPLAAAQPGHARRQLAAPAREAALEELLEEVPAPVLVEEVRELPEELSLAAREERLPGGRETVEDVRPSRSFPKMPRIMLRILPSETRSTARIAPPWMTMA